MNQRVLNQAGLHIQTSREGKCLGLGVDFHQSELARLGRWGFGCPARIPQHF
jgi:hypothetical protein